MRCILAIMVFLSTPILLLAGELKVTIISIPQTCVGDTLKINARVENINNTYPINFISTQVYVRRAGELVCQKFVTPVFALTPLQQKEMEINMNWAPDVAGALDVELRAVSPEAINSPQSTTQGMTVCDNSACPKKPTFGGTTIYLGSGANGSISVTTPRPQCCYQYKFTIVTGREAVTDHSPRDWSQVGAATTATVTVDRTKLSTTTIVGRIDWKVCDGSDRGSEYILVRDGNAGTANASTPAPSPSTAGQTPNSGTVADPVITSTREFAHTMPVDVISSAEIDIPMERTYLSKLANVRVQEHDFGPGWTHPFDYRLVRGEGEMIIMAPMGKMIRFRLVNSAWQKDWPTDQAYGFSAPTDSTYAYYDPTQKLFVIFNKDGILKGLENTHGFQNTVLTSNGWISKISTPSGRGLTFTRDSVGRITSITNGITTIQYGYTNGILTSVTDGNGNETTYLYQTGTPFLTSWITPENRTPLTNTYDATGGVTKQDLGDGFTIDLSKAGQTTTMGFPLGVMRTHKHDDQAQLLESTSPSGGRATFTYNTTGNRTSVTDMEGGVRTDVFTNGQLTRRTLPDGTVTDKFFESREWRDINLDEIKRIEVLKGPQTIYGRDGISGVITTITNNNGAQTDLTYGAGGYLPSSVSDFYGVTQYQYSQDGQPIRITLPDGSVMTLTYNVAGLVTETKRDAQPYETFTYDNNGDLTQWKRLDATYRFTYDKDRQRSSIIDPLNRTWTFGRDQRDRIIVIRNPTDTGVKINWIGPIMSGMTFGDGQRYTMTPNADGFLNKVQNSLGHEWTITPNKEGDPTRLTYPDGTSWLYGQDVMGRTSSMTAPSGAEYTFTYGVTGMREGLTYPYGLDISTTWNDQRTKSTTSVGGRYEIDVERYFSSKNSFTFNITDADLHAWRSETNGQTRSTTYTSPSGSTTTVTRDTEWNTTGMSFGMGVELQYQYTNGQLTKITDGTNQRTYEHNVAGDVTRINSEVVERDPAGRPNGFLGVKAERTTGGRIQAISLGSKVHATYEYDLAGNVIGITDDLGGKTKIDYTSSGRIDKITMPGEFTIDYDWTLDGKIGSVSTSDDWRMQYTYLSDGRIGTIERTDDVPFDELDDEDADYSWDEDGKINNGSYDGWGNMTGRIGLDLGLSYSGLGLKGATKDQLQYTYTSDPMGYPSRLNEPSTSDTRIRFNHLTSQPVPIEYSESWGQWRIVSLPNGRPLYGISQSGDRCYYIDDGRGNVVREESALNEMDRHIWYTPYGETIGNTGRDGILGYGGLEGTTSFFGGQIQLDGSKTYLPQFGKYNLSEGYLSEFTRLSDPFGHYSDRNRDRDPRLDDLYISECTSSPQDFTPKIDLGKRYAFRLSDPVLEYKIMKPKTEISLNDIGPFGQVFSEIKLLRSGLDRASKEEEVILRERIEDFEDSVRQVVDPLSQLFLDLFPPLDTFPQTEPRTEPEPKRETQRKK